MTRSGGSLRLRAVAAGLALACCAGAAGWGGSASAASPVRIAAAFEPGARLGAATTVSLDLAVDSSVERSPVREIHLLHPPGLGIATSGLGLESCTPPARAFERVMLSGAGRRCSTNAVLGRGSAIAEVRVGGQTIPATASIEMLTGRPGAGRMGLVYFVDGIRPFGVRLAYSGELRAARGPYEGDISIAVAPIPDLQYDVVVALVQARLVIGDVTYYERLRGKSIAYRPEGVVLPQRCPHGGFRFAARVRFENGRRARATSTVPCPRR